MAKKKDSEKQNAADNSNKNGEEPNFEDPDGYVDDISDEELLGDMLARKPKETDGFESVIIVDGIPEVGSDRLEKLKGVIEKIFSKFGTIVSDFYPKNDQGVTDGYVFIEYNNAQSARDAVAQLNNYKLDKKHTFIVNLFTDYDKFTGIPDQWEPPTPSPFPERPNLQEYLIEPDGYDQYLLFDTDWHVQIWLNSSPHPTLLEDRERWTESFVRWSPLGTYLATCHKLGVALWGGPNFTKVMRFVQSNVQVIDFSPCEQYLITLSPAESADQKKLIIFDIRTGMEKRSFVIDGAPTWPIFRWSKDDKYFARIGPNMLSVYETPSFGLLDKKSIAVNGIRDFMWSPSDNVLAYWVAEDKDVPAKVVLLEIPSRQEIRANNLFNVADCKIHWQKNGDYLCVKVDRYAKLKKGEGEVKYSGMHYNFEIFHMREKNIPVDIIEIKEPIQAFAWEPVGSKFAIVHGEPNNTKVAFYDIKSAQKLSLMKLLEKKVCSHLFWSPAGQYIVLAECRGEGGILEFIDTNDFSTMATGEHYKATQVEWDPTGRYVVTAVSAWSQKMDTGFWIWSFQGKVIRRNNLNTFCEFKWRPRPPTLLSEKQLKDIKKNLKKYTVQFEQKDRIRLTKASKDVVEKRQKLWRDFQEYREKRIEEWKQQKDARLQLRHNIDTDNINNDSHNHEEEIVEFIVKEEITVID